VVLASDTLVEDDESELLEQPEGIAPVDGEAGPLKSIASDPAASPEQIEAEFFAKGRPSSLLQRMIEPEEIANLVAYVASPLSSATNGAALRVDGGVTPTIG
jgi:enoyl-[acyl-carrier-protein] reductase (NADH)